MSESERVALERLSMLVALALPEDVLLAHVPWSSSLRLHKPERLGPWVAEAPTAGITAMGDTPTLAVARLFEKMGRP